MWSIHATDYYPATKRNKIPIAQMNPGHVPRQSSQTAKATRRGAPRTCDAHEGPSQAQAAEMGGPQSMAAAVRGSFGAVQCTALRIHYSH